MIETILQCLKEGQLKDLAGTNLAASLPVAEELVNYVLAARPDSAVKELKAFLVDNDQAVLRIGVDTPVLGYQRRNLRLRLRGTVEPGRQEWLYFDVIDGLKFMDKPLLNAARNLLADRLSGGFHFGSEGFALHLGVILQKAGYGYLWPALKALQLHSEQGKLIINMHLKID